MSRRFESEIALIIRDNADHIRTELAGIRHLLEYDIKPKPSQIIYDTYYDTKREFLKEKKIGLRVRRIDSTMLISTKSDIRRTAGNVIQRREVELPWSYESIRRLARHLKLNSPIMSASKFRSIPVSRTLATMGLDAIQERRTNREAREVVRRSEIPSLILSELAIDKVTYNFKKAMVGISEIEVEAKAARSLPSVRGIADALVSKYGPSVQQWFHGKFVTGLAIQKLLRTGALKEYLVNGDLGPEAFELIDRSIRSGEF